VLDSDLYKSLGLRSAFFFDKETFGTDRLLTGDIRDDAFLAAAPVSDAVRRDHKWLLTERFDPMPGLRQSEKKARLVRMSYADFLTKLWKLDPGVLPLYQPRPHGYSASASRPCRRRTPSASGIPDTPRWAWISR
jgi:spermidine dehydrogenase